MSICTQNPYRKQKQNKKKHQMVQPSPTSATFLPPASSKVRRFFAGGSCATSSWQHLAALSAKRRVVCAYVVIWVVWFPDCGLMLLCVLLGINANNSEDSLISPRNEWKNPRPDPLAKLPAPGGSYHQKSIVTDGSRIHCIKCFH